MKHSAKWRMAPPMLGRGEVIVMALAALLLALPLVAQDKPVMQTAEGTANWESRFQIDGFPTGKYNIYVEGKDKAGNVAIGGPFNVFIDPKSDLPIVHVLNPLQGQRVGGDLTIVGVCSDDDGVQKVEVAIDDGPFVRAQGSDLWMLTVNTKTVPDGRRTISVRGTDINGLVGPVVKVAFDLDHFKPVVDIASPVSGALVTGAVKLSGTVSDANGLRDLDLSVDGGKLWSKIDLKRGKDLTKVDFQALVDSKKLKDGPELLEFRSHDGVGSLGTTAHLLMVANAKPAFAIARPLPAAPVHGTVMVAGSVKDVVGIKRLSWEAPGIGKGDIELRRGDPFFEKSFNSRDIKGDQFLVTLSAEDFAGNVSTFVVNRKIDRQADKPVLRIDFPTAGAVVKAGDRVFGSALDEDGVVAVRYSIDGGAAQETKADGSFVFDLPDLASGKHLLSISARDSFGIVGDAATVSFVYDKGPGALTVDALVPASAKAGSAGRGFSQGAVVSIDGGEVLVGKISAPNPLTKSEWRVGDGPARKLELVKGATATDWSWRIPIDTSFPYGFAPVSIDVADAFGNAYGGKALLYVTNYASPREDTGFTFDDSRVLGDPRGSVDAQGAGGIVVLGKTDPFVGIFWREEIASVRLEPQTGLLAPTFDGNLISISAAAEGKSEAEKIVVITKKGHEFSAGPWTFVTDTTAPRLTIDSPHQGALSKSSIDVKGNAADAGGLASLSWRVSPAGSPHDLKVDSGGAFGFTVMPADLGFSMADIEVDATDVAGNVGKAYVALGIETKAPTVDFVSPAPGSEVSGPEAVVARLVDASGIASVEYAVDGRSFQPVESPGGWLVAKVDFSAFPKSSWRVTDRAGNVTVASPDVKVVTKPPVPAIGDSLSIAPGDGEGRIELAGTAGTRKLSVLVPLLADQAALDGDARFGARLLVSGALSLKGSLTAVASASGPAAIKAVSMSLDKGSTWTALGGAKDQKSAPSAMPLGIGLDSVKQLQPGPGRLLFKVEDFDGGTGYAAVDIFVDNNPPSLQLAGPAAGQDPVAGIVPVVVRASDEVGLSSLVWSTGQGSPQDLGLVSGSSWYAISIDPASAIKGAAFQGTLIAKDLAGNTLSLPVKLAYDAAAAREVPTIELGSDAKFLVAGDRVSARAEGPEGPVPVALSIDGTSLADSEGGALCVAIPDLTPGQHQLSVVSGASGKAEAKKTILVEGPAPVFASLAVGDAKAKSPFAPGASLALGAQAQFTGEIVASNGLSSLDCSVNGKPVTATLGKPTQAGGGLPFSLPLAGLPYGKIVITLTAKDAAGLVVSRDFVFVSILPALSGVDDGEGLRFEDSRVAESDDGIKVLLAPGDMLTGRFNGRAIAKLALVPPTSLLEAAFDGAIVTVTAKGEGPTAATKVEVTTVDGDVFDWGPAVFFVDAAPPSISASSPVDLDWTKGKVRLAGSAEAGKETIARVEYSLDGGDWLPLAKSGTKPAAATSPTQAPPVQPASAGAWPFDTTIDLAVPDGTTSLSLRLVDAAGRSTASTRIFTKDTVPPEFTQVLPAPDEAVNGLTTFIGEVSDAGRVASVSFLSSPEGNPEAVDGTLSFGGSLDLAKLPAPLPDGSGFKAVDAAGNVSVLQPRLTIDAQADKPVVEINAPTENEVIRQNFAIAGVAFDDDGVASISYRIDGGNWRDSPLDGMGFSLPIALDDTTDNEHSIEIKATDIYGVVGDMVKRSWRISKEEPFALLTTPAATKVVSGSVDVSGSASDANGIGSMALSFDNGTSWQSPQGTTAWSYRLDTKTLADGPHAILLRPVDGYDTPGLAAALITVDNRPPEAVLDTPLDGAKVADSLSVSGRVADNTGLAAASLEIAPVGSATPALMKLDLDTARVQSRSVDISSLPPGNYVVRLIAVDRAGNRSLASRNFSVIKKTDEESLEILYPQPGASISGPFTLSGILRANGKVESADILVDGAKVAELQPDSGGVFNYTFKDGLTAEGAHDLAVTCRVDDTRDLSSQTQKLDWHSLGPWLTIDNLAAESFLPYRPMLRGHAGFRAAAPDPADKTAVAAFQKSAKDRSVKGVEVSLDGGRSWSKASGKDAWSFRIETGDFPEGPLFVIVRVDFGDGSYVAMPSRFRLDKTPPRLEVLAPAPSSRQNQAIDVLGTASDENGIESVKVTLRKGDKGNYEVPSFIQGLYLDGHVLGATNYEVGAGLTFFGDNVKLQGEYGQAPTVDAATGLASSFGGTMFGAKLIANLFYMPLSSLLGPDWEWLSLSLGLGANFSYFSIVNGDPSQGLMLSSIFGQVEFPKVTLKSLPAFRKYSFYFEYQMWVLSSVVQGGFIPKASFGVRLGIF